MNRRDLVLAILAASEGRPYTPVQIQKAVFLICDQLPHLMSREGIVLEAEDLRYQSGRSRDWMNKGNGWCSNAPKTS